MLSEIIKAHAQPSLMLSMGIRVTTHHGNAVTSDDDDTIFVMHVKQSLSQNEDLQQTIHACNLLSETSKLQWSLM